MVGTAGNDAAVLQMCISPSLLRYIVRTERVLIFTRHSGPATTPVISGRETLAKSEQQCGDCGKIKSATCRQAKVQRPTTHLTDDLFDLARTDLGFQLGNVLLLETGVVGGGQKTQSARCAVSKIQLISPNPFTHRFDERHAFLDDLLRVSPVRRALGNAL